MTHLRNSSFIFRARYAKWKIKTSKFGFVSIVFLNVNFIFFYQRCDCVIGIIISSLKGDGNTQRTDRCSRHLVILGNLTRGDRYRDSNPPSVVLNWLVPLLQYFFLIIKSMFLLLYNFKHL